MARKIIVNLYFLVFLNGFLFAGLIYLRQEDLYERDLFSAIVTKIKSDLKTNNKDTFLLRSLAMAYELQHNRQNIFGEQNIVGTDNNSILHSATEDLMAAKGSCGSYSLVLARILKSNACEVRIGQMKVNNIYGGHIVVETKINNRWIVVDPMYNVYFKNPDGSLASFKEVNQNWPYFSKQLPPGYPSSYKFEDIRYTNWDKIPILSTLTKKTINIVIGKEAADTFSLRPKIIRAHHFLFIGLTWVYGLLTLLIIWKFWKRRKALK